VQLQALVGAQAARALDHGLEDDVLQLRRDVVGKGVCWAGWGVGERGVREVRVSV